MDFRLTDAQSEFKALARRLLAKRYRAAQVADASAAPADEADFWPLLRDLGWLNHALGPVELAVLAEECGHALGPGSWCTTAALALPVYRAAGVAVDGPAALADGSQECQADSDGTGWRLSGEIADVVDGMSATELIVVARAETGLAMFGVSPNDDGVTLTEFATVDPRRPFCDVTLNRAPARLLVEGPDVPSLLTSVTYHASVLLACEGVGVAERALAIGVAYAKTRVQFGRPIGSYQAVSHQLAECYADVEIARSLAYRAAAVLADGGQHPGEAVACAVHASRQAALRTCAVATQVCGGIGVTWEFELHWWYRRALWLDAYHASRPDPLIALESVLLS